MPLNFKATAVLAIAGAAMSAIALSGPAAHAATETCGGYCVTMASQSLGSGEEIAVSGNGGVTMAPGFTPKEDFIGLAVGTVAQLAQAGQIPSSLAATYSHEIVYEFSYAPHGELTGNCLGVSSPAAGATVKLQFCGAPTNGEPAPSWEAQKGTLWIGIYRDHSGNFEPFINVAVSAHAAVALTAGTAGGPLKIGYLSVKSGLVAANQMWETMIGIFGQEQAWPTPTGNEPSLPGDR